MILILTDSPLNPKAEAELWAGLDRFSGLGRNDCSVVSLIACPRGKGKDPKPGEIAAALPDFLDTLEAAAPALVVTAGGLATRTMLGPVSLNNVHGILHTADVAGRQYQVLPIYHPGSGLGNKGYLAAFAWDLTQFSRVFDEPWKEAEAAICGWQRLEGFGVPTSVVAIDTEGWTDKPHSLSYCHDGKFGMVIRADMRQTLAVFNTWLHGKQVVMHNGLHDVPVLRAMGVEVGAYHDTQVLAYHDMIRTGCGVLDSEAQNLGTLAYRECQMKLGELRDIPGVDFETKTIPYSDAVMQYAGEDAVATWRLFACYRQKGLVETQAYQIDMGQVGLVEQMISTGIPFDADATLDYYMNVLDKLAEAKDTMRAMAKKLGNYDFNPGSHPQVRELITKRIGLRIRKRTRGGLASTNEKALADHKGHPFVQAVQTYRELQKLTGTYIQPLLEEIAQ